MNMKLIIYLAIIIAAFSLSAPKSYSDEEEEFHKTYTVNAGTDVEVNNINGEINISTWDGNNVDIQALKRTKEDKDELDKVTIEVNLNEILEIKTVYRKPAEEDSFFRRIFDWGGNSPKVSVDFTIKLPVSAILSKAVSVNGNVSIHGTHGDTVTKTINGSINVDNTDGLVEAKTTNGNISVTGGATVRDAKTINGSISISDGALIGQAETINGSIKASLLKNRIENTNISTVNGSVDLYLSPDINADISLKTANGKISTESFLMKVNTISKREFIGTLGSGGQTISVRTVNGSINLYKN